MKHLLGLIVLSLLVAVPAQAVTAEQLGTDALIPATATADSATASLDALKALKLDAQFLQSGARTTQFSTIKNAAAVEDLTFDVPDYGRVVFKETVDLSTPETQALLAELPKHLKFEKLSITIDDALYDALASPVELLYYRIPFVWDPAISRNGLVLEAKSVQRYVRTTLDDQDIVSFIASQSGTYALVPQVELHVENESISKRSPFTFSGRVSDPNALVRITVNTTDIAASDIVVDKQTGEFTSSASLVNGSNIIVVRAKSAYGDTTPISAVVYYQQRQQPQPQPQETSPIVFLAIALSVVAVGLVVAVRLAKR